MGDLRQRYAIDRDFTVDQHHRNAGVFRLLHGGDAGLGIGVIQNDALNLAADNQADELPWRLTSSPCDSTSVW